MIALCLFIWEKKGNASPLPVRVGIRTTNAAQTQDYAWHCQSVLPMKAYFWILVWSACEWQYRNIATWTH